MKSILSFIYTQLNSFGYKVFDKRPPANTAYPFIEYGVNEPFRNVHPIFYTLTIDVWDRDQSSFRVETLASDIDDLLENMAYSDSDIQVKVKRQTRLKLDDSDIEIKRRQLIYQLRVFFKE